MMALEYAEEQARNLASVLSPFAARLEIAGSIRRAVHEVKDIEIVMIRNPKKMLDLAALLDSPGWIRVKGRPGGKYMQFKRTPHSSMALDLFFVSPENWGSCLAIRTGPAGFSHMLALTWVKMGYASQDFKLIHERTGESHNFSEEKDFFRFLKIPYLPPEKRF